MCSSDLFLAEDENLELAFGDLPNKDTALFRLDLIRYLERRVKGASPMFTPGMIIASLPIQTSFPTTVSPAQTQACTLRERTRSSFITNAMWRPLQRPATTKVGACTCGTVRAVPAQI